MRNPATEVLLGVPSNSLIAQDPDFLSCLRIYGPRYLGLCFLFISCSILVFRMSTKSPTFNGALLNRLINLLSNWALDRKRALIRDSAALSKSSGLFCSWRMLSASKSDEEMPLRYPWIMKVASVRSKGSTG